jgi:hypothetical protein
VYGLISCRRVSEAQPLIPTSSHSPQVYPAADSGAIALRAAIHAAAAGGAQWYCDVAFGLMGAQVLGAQAPALDPEPPSPECTVHAPPARGVGVWPPAHIKGCTSLPHFPATPPRRSAARSRRRARRLPASCCSCLCSMPPVRGHSPTPGGPTCHRQQVTCLASTLAWRGSGGLRQLHVTLSRPCRVRRAFGTSLPHRPRAPAGRRAGVARARGAQRAPRRDRLGGGALGVPGGPHRLHAHVRAGGRKAGHASTACQHRPLREPDGNGFGPTPAQAPHAVLPCTCNYLPTYLAWPRLLAAVGRMPARPQRHALYLLLSQPPCASSLTRHALTRSSITCLTPPARRAPNARRPATPARPSCWRCGSSRASRPARAWPARPCCWQSAPPRSTPPACSPASRPRPRRSARWPPPARPPAPRGARRAAAGPAGGRGARRWLPACWHTRCRWRCGCCSCGTRRTLSRRRRPTTAAAPISGAR